MDGSVGTEERRTSIPRDSQVGQRYVAIDIAAVGRQYGYRCCPNSVLFEGEQDMTHVCSCAQRNLLGQKNMILRSLHIRYRTKTYPTVLEETGQIRFEGG